MKYLLITLLGLSILAACKKVDTPDSREEELRNGRWKRTDLRIKYDPYIGKDTLLPYYDSILPACKKDNFIIFGINHDATLNAGDVKCINGPDPESIPFYWSLEQNKTRMTLIGANDMFFDSSVIDANIDAYGPSQFKISYVEFHTNPINNTRKDTLTFFYTFTKF